MKAPSILKLSFQRIPTRTLRFNKFSNSFNRCLGGNASANDRLFSTRVSGVTVDSPQENTLVVHVNTDNHGSYDAVVKSDTIEFNKAKSFIDDTLSRSLIGLDPTDQNGIDILLEKLDNTEQRIEIGQELLTGTSMAIARTGAAVMKQSLVRYLGDMTKQTEFRLPLPLCHVFGSDVSVIFFGETFSKTQEWLKDLEDYISTQNVKLPNPEVSEDADDIVFALSALEIMDSAALGLHMSNAPLESIISLAKSRPVLALIDPIDFSRENISSKTIFEEYAMLRKTLGPKFQLCVGKPFNKKLDTIKLALKKQVANVICLDIAQHGTVSRMLEVSDQVQKAGWDVLYSDYESILADPSFVASLCVSQSISAVHLTRENLSPLSKALVDIENELLSKIATKGNQKKLQN